MHVLFLGNGFDLYHGLKTSYLDFLKIINHLEEFKSDVNYYLKEHKHDGKERIFKEYFDETKNMNIEEVNRIVYLLLDNIWAIYYGECNANIQGWIDFENEMNPVFDLFKNLFSKGIGEKSQEKYHASSAYFAESYKEVAIAKILTMFFVSEEDSKFRIKGDYFDEKYGVLKDKIIDRLEKDLEKFTLAFNIYLRQFVESKQINEYKWIEDLAPDRIISFNYTATEGLYNFDISLEAQAHIHGSTLWNNLVFGTDLIDDDDTEFVCFSKRYQRLMKVGDYSYIDYLYEPYDYADLFDNGEKRNLIVSFFGCSLDKNDSPIFSDFINRADKINIYCNGFSSYKKTVGNLVSIFGSKMISELGRKKMISFYDLTMSRKDGKPREIKPYIYYRKKIKMENNVDNCQ